MKPSLPKLLAKNAQSKSADAGATLLGKMSLVALCVCLPSCAGPKDPISKLLKDNGNFAVVRPVRTGLSLGDVHNKANLQESSIPMSRVLGANELTKLMGENMQSINLPIEGGQSSYGITADAAYVGVAKAALNASGAKKFSVKAHDAVIYDAPFDATLYPEIIPAIQKKYPRVNLSEKYIIRSLIKVKGLEYEFYKDNGGKIDLSADPELVKELTAKFGATWKVSKNSSLIITEPRFIGYRLAKVSRDGQLKGASAFPSGPGAPPAGGSLYKLEQPKVNNFQY
jgi:hypothetical protein